MTMTNISGARDPDFDSFEKDSPLVVKFILQFLMDLVLNLTIVSLILNDLRYSRNQVQWGSLFYGRQSRRIQPLGSYPFFQHFGIAELAYGAH